MSSFSVEPVVLIKVNVPASSDKIGKIMDYVMEKKIYSVNMLVCGGGMYYALHNTEHAEVLKEFIMSLDIALIE